MRKKLALQGMVKLIVGIVTLGLLLFLPAGTFHFPGAWRMIGVLFIPMLILGTVFATYLGFAELLRENEYLSRTVEVQENQTVVSTGLYGIVRHPMYAIIFWIFLSMPLIVGSFFALIPMAFLPFLLAKRIQNEEKVLRENLNGYEEYTKKVRYRLIPLVW